MTITLTLGNEGENIELSGSLPLSEIDTETLQNLQDAISYELDRRSQEYMAEGLND